MTKKLPWDLIVSKLRNQLSSKDEVLFNEWLTTDDHRRLFEQLEIVWEKVQQKVSVYEPDLEYYWNELSARIDQETVKAEKSAKTLKRSLMSGRVWRIAAALAIIISSTFFFAYYFGKYNSVNPQEYIAYSTLNTKSKVLLPDSTEVWLHNNSSITYKFNEDLNQRELNLSGEAFFKVKHSKEFAFVVATKGVQVKVHGTQFNVNSYPATDNVLVSLYEGSVSMTANENDVYLKPGEEGLFDSKNKNISVAEGDVEFAKIWTSDKIRFENKNLREVCRYLSKWYGVQFEIDPQINNNQSYTFTFRGQDLDEVVGIMAKIHSFDCVIDDEANMVRIHK